MKRALWPVAVVLWAVALVGMVVPGAAAAAPVELGDLSFSFPQLCILLAVGAAWGDLRASNRERDRRIERIEKHVFED